MRNDSNIHPSSVIAPEAQIGSNVSIGPFCHIGDQVKIGDDCEIKSHVYLEGPTTIGKRNIIWPFAALGGAAQHLKNNTTDDQLIIGDDNLIREGAKIHRGTSHGEKVTRIGNSNLIMGDVHIAHDSTIGDNNILTHGSTLGGHVIVGNKVVVGGHAAIHQFCRLGDYCFIGKCTAVAQDVPPYIMYAHNGRETVNLLNIKGLQRALWKDEAQAAAKNIYKIFYRKHPTTQAALDSPETQELANKFPEVAFFVDFIKSSSRGIAR
ncbi:MAG: acyl-ACP--UDP-N-acetylglucosamine O-acyltransferase [Gammaproteobacteria bacterium]|nr:acyl-ACP--UDP-N-acetylglucosamine O-acyltransferase [Gammaproteobacteria bacterium]